MNMPGFTAETSVYRTSGQYQMTAGFDANGAIIRPQACDIACLADCTPDCNEFIGQARARCLKACRLECCTPPPPQCTCTKTKCCQGNCSTVSIPC